MTFTNPEFTSWRYFESIVFLSSEIFNILSERSRFALLFFILRNIVDDPVSVIIYEISNSNELLVLILGLAFALAMCEI
ncbi:hypothetical protein QMY54_05026 [Pseudomonas rhodesiae]|nr:hypothetical protein QMY54_05026 [Pseudomonas rhodesiae]